DRIVGSDDQGLRGGARRARFDCEDAGGRRSTAREIARALRARRTALALLPFQAGRRGAPHRDPQPPRRDPAPAAHPRPRHRFEPGEGTTTSHDLRTWLDARRGAVDAALERVLPSSPTAPANVCDAMRHSVTAGGKRLRPMLVLAAAE